MSKSRIASRGVAVVLAAATLIGGYAVLVSRVQIDVGDVNDLSFWQIPIHITNNGYWATYDLRYLCHIGTVTVVGQPGIRITDLEGGNMLHPIPHLSALDSFDATCPLKIEGFDTRIDALDVIVASQPLIPLWQSITCARFVQTDISPSHFSWHRVAQDFGHCRQLLTERERSLQQHRQE